MNEQVLNIKFDKDLKTRVIKQLREWSLVIKRYFQNPKNAVLALPQKGSWEPIFIYAVTAGVAQGLILGLSLMGPFGVRAFGAIFSSAIAAACLIPLGGATLHWVSTLFHKEAGIYRSSFFLAQISIFAVIGTLGGVIFPLLTFAVQAWSFYLLFLFGKHAVQLSNKQLFWILGTIVGISLLVVGISATGLYFLFSQ